MRTPPGLPLGVAALSVALVSFLSGTPVRAADLTGLEHELARAESLKERDELDSALVVVENVLPEIRDAGEVELAGRALRMAALLAGWLGRPEYGEQLNRERVTVAEVAGDSLLLVRAVHDLAVAVDGQGRPPRAIPLLERTIELGHATGELKYVARGEVTLARRELRTGDFESARNRIGVALELLENPKIGSKKDRYSTILMLGILHARTGNADSARACWEETLAWARTESANLHGQSLVNLGRLDISAGYTGLAARNFQEAYVILRDSDNLRSACLAGQNAALALRALGRYDDSIAMLEVQRDLARERNWADYEGTALLNLGEVARSRGRYGSAASYYRESIAVLAGRRDYEREANARAGLARALASMDSSEAAVATLEQAVAELRGHVDFEKQCQLDQTLGEVLLDDGRPEDALPVVERALAIAREKGYARELLRALVLLAEVERQLGMTERAKQTLIEASVEWEASRSLLADAEWREQRGRRGARIFTELADLVLREREQNEDAVEQAYAVLQRYKARTLQERLIGSGETDVAIVMPPAMTTLELRTGVLRPDDLLLDFYVGPRVSFLFAVTTSAARVIPLPGEADELFESVARYRELASAPPRDAESGTEALLEATADTITQRLLGAALEGRATPQRILLVPDGPLHLLGLGSLRWDGGALIDRCEIVRLPSREFLRPTAGGPDDGASPATSLLAIAGRRGEGSQELTGTLREVRDLGRRFRNATVRTEPASGEPMITPEELTGYGILHFAAHTNVDDQRPWDSGIRLGVVTDDPDREEEAFLRASTIASLDLPARLAVISGCESAGGRLVTGEGAVGLTSAFLCAGVPAVMATLWPVDDRTAPRLMRTFYDRLGAGDTAAAALRAAQRELRADPATRLPFYWAGFTLVGEGDLRVNLERRPAGFAAMRLLSMSAAAAVAAWLLTAWILSRWQGGGRRFVFVEPETE